MISRAAALAVVLALLSAGAIPCAGWESTSQARHDCCVDGKCPDEVSNTSGHSSSHPGGVTQAEADRCCATSEQTHQQRASQFADASFALIPPAETSTVLDSSALLLPDRIARDRASAPSPPTRLHVLFSVFLV
jgi:hypothetical protein